MTISSGTTTLTRDMYYANLTISGTGKLIAAGFRVFASGTLDLSNAGAGAISANGASATGSIAMSRAAGWLDAGQTSGAGGGSSTANGSAAAYAVCLGGLGGAGGDGYSSYVGGAQTGAAIPRQRVVPSPFAYASVPIATGGGPGSGGAGTGGAGGLGGGIIQIFAAVINRGSSTSSGAIAANGGNGASGDGGGGGGGGGMVAIVAGAMTGTSAPGAISASAGSGGSGSRHSGSSGSAGNILVFNLGAKSVAGSATGAASL